MNSARLVYRLTIKIIFITIILSFTATPTFAIKNTEDQQITHLQANNQINGAVWSQAEDYVLTWAENGEVHVIDSHTGQAKLTLLHERDVRQAVWNWDETRIITREHGGHAYVWDAETGEQLIDLGNPIFSVRVSQFENRVLLLGDTVEIWDLDNNESLLNIPVQAQSVTWNADETRVILRDGDTAQIWNIETGQPSLVAHHTNQVLGVHLSHSEEMLYTWVLFGYTAGGGHIWDIAKQQMILTFPREESTQEGIWDFKGGRWSPDDARVATWSQRTNESQITGHIRIWNTSDNSLIATLETNQPVKTVLWSDDGNLVFIRTAVELSIWDIEAEAYIFREMRTSWVGARWNLNDQTILAWDASSNINIWDFATDTLLTSFRHSAVRGARWNADYTRILSWSKAGTIQITDAATGDILLTWDSQD